MALPNMFHRRGSGAVVDPDHDRARDNDRNNDGIDDRRTVSTVDRDRNGIDDRGTATVVDRDRNGIDDRAQPPVAPAVTAPPEAPAPAPEPVVRTSRTSLLATLGLVVGVTATLASLTGRLAPVGIALGVLGLLLALGGVLASARRLVNGRGVAFLGVLAALTGIVFGVLALNDAASWLNSDVNQVDRLRAWLDAQLPFMDSW